MVAPRAALALAACAALALAACATHRYPAPAIDPRADVTARARQYERFELREARIGSSGRAWASKAHPLPPGYSSVDYQQLFARYDETSRAYRRAEIYPAVGGGATVLGISLLLAGTLLQVGCHAEEESGCAGGSAPYYVSGGVFLVGGVVASGYGAFVFRGLGEQYNRALREELGVSEYEKR